MWGKAKLKDVCKILGGIPAPKDKASFDESGVPFVRMRDLGRYHLTTNLTSTEQKIKSSLKTAKKLKLIPKDAILLPRSGSVALNHRAILGQDSIIVSHICALVVKDSDRLSHRFLYYWLCRFDMNRIAKKTTGLDAINFTDLGNITISFPNIETQNKITALLDKVSSVLRKREDTINQYDELLRAIFLETFNNPMERPSKWKLAPISKSLTNISSGTSYSGQENKQLEEDELGVLKVSAVTKGFFNANAFKAVRKNTITRKIINPKKGDLLFSRANTLELVGATCIVDADYNNLFLPDKIWKVETNETLIRKVYLYYVLQNKDLRKTFLTIATGSSGSMLNISMDKFKNLVIPYPPLELQQQFEDIYLRYIKLKSGLQKSHKNLLELFSSISQLAFKGELDFNTAIDLEILLERGYTFFKENSDKKAIELLIEKLDKDELNDNKFHDQGLYDQAKRILFRLLQDKKVTQIFDENSKRIKLVIR